MANVTPTHRMRIDGVPAWEYAAQWGCGNSGDGAMFYNVSDGPDRFGKTTPADLSKAQWMKFRDIVVNQRNAVAAKVATATGRKETGWKQRDVDNLDKLAKWVEYHAGTLDTRGNWR